MASSLGGPAFDVASPGLPEHVLGRSVFEALASKGFAVVPQDAAGEWFGEVHRNIKQIEAEGLLQPLPPQVSDGLFGVSGSGKYYELKNPEAEPDDWEGDALRFADQLISQMGELLEPYMEELGTTLLGRTPAVLLETSDAIEERPALTDTEASKWLGIFSSAKLHILHFLGPSWGTLELRVMGEDDMEPYSIPAGPGVMVIMRADFILHEFKSPQPSYALSSYACGTRLPWFKRSRGDDLIPAAKAIDQWIVSRMMELRRAPTSDVELSPQAIPRSIQRTMNRMFVKGERASIRGTSCKITNFTDTDTFHHGLTTCPDFAQEVPYTRWDNTEHYNPEPEGYHYGKVNCMHMCCADDMEMFDNKFFLISPNEAAKMDPCERQLLEVGYMGLANAGLKKKDIMGSDCAVYVAWMSEANVGSEDRGMGANRISFCLGCKGPSLACDVDHASALLAVKTACNELHRESTQGIAIGCYINQNPQAWMVHLGAHMMSPAGRTCPFDDQASGFIRADTVASCYVRRLAEKVDGEDVWDDKVLQYGVIVGTTCKNQGRTSSLTGVYGPSLQDLFSEGARQASISLLDVDVAECDARGDVMSDAVEVTAVLRAFRPDSEAIDHDSPVMVGGSKSHFGNSYPASGMVTLLKGLVAGVYGNYSPIVHLNQINSLIHNDAFGHPVSIPQECIEMATDMSYTSVAACGNGGTNAQLLVWNRVDPGRMSLGRPGAVLKPQFWPGGGGMLMPDEKPARNYTIVGTWSCWDRPENMEMEEEGVYGYTVTLGWNCWERFQIWLDGDRDRVLHPDVAKAPNSTPAQGPDQVETVWSWLIDGRMVLVSERDEAEATGFAGDLVPVAAAGGPAGYIELPHKDSGQPGAKYRVRLHVVGKWRSVDWELISAAPSALANRPSDTGQYFVTGSFNDWAFEKMSADFNTEGLYSTEVQVYREREYFQIVRNEDWQQMIYPDPLNLHRNELSEVCGPDEEGHGYSWEIRGNVGDTYHIDFQRCWDELGFQQMSVSWSRVRGQTISRAIVAEKTRTKYFLVGSWDAYRTRREMTRDGDGFSAEVSIAGRGNFRILMDGCWGAVLSPDVADADPAVYHRVLGPANCSDLQWTFGENSDEVQGYLIRLGISRIGRPTAVHCFKT